MANQHTCMAEVDEANLNWEVQTAGPGVMTRGERGVPVKAASRTSLESPQECHQWRLSCQQFHLQDSSPISWGMGIKSSRD